MNLQDWIDKGKPLSSFINCDCMELMATIPDKYFELCICDPPYGIGGGLKGGRPFSMLNGDKWDNPPDDKYFAELYRISNNQIIWGGNYFNLGRTRGFIIWHKENDGRSFSECEFAWTSFECPSRIYKQRFIGKKESLHPTEKPTALYRWLLQKYAKKGDKIFDSHVGSASSLIACSLEGFEYVGCELDSDYYKEARLRLLKETDRNNYIKEIKDTNFFSKRK
jgi:site-specific DNA-methyltransferase (adenine-specific)